MRIRASLHGSEIDAYIITSFDDHLNEDIADHDKRRQYISGFTGPSAVVAVGLIFDYNRRLHEMTHETVTPYPIALNTFRGFQFRLHCIPWHFGRMNSSWRRPIQSWIAIGKYSAPVKSQIWSNGCDPNWLRRLELVPIRILCPIICGNNGTMSCIRNSFVWFAWIEIWSIWCGMIDRNRSTMRCTCNRICMPAKNGKPKWKRCAIIWCSCDAMQWLWHRSPKSRIYWICAAEICRILRSLRYVLLPFHVRPLRSNLKATAFISL